MWSTPHIWKGTLDPAAPVDNLIIQFNRARMPLDALDEKTQVFDLITQVLKPLSCSNFIGKFWRAGQLCSNFQKVVKPVCHYSHGITTGMHALDEKMRVALGCLLMTYCLEIE
jgi:di/tripeptidase